jgi:aminodeoxyfutalosine deaminase
LRLYEKLGIDVSFFKPSGKTSLQTFLPWLKNYQSLILVHNVLTSKEDAAFAQNLSPATDHRSLYYCLCPNANLYITNTLPGIELLTEPPFGLAAAGGVVLGTDSLASNHQLNIWEEIKTLQKHIPSIDLITLLQWATINGATALQMQQQLGSFEKGKKPGIILIEGTDNASLTTNSSSKRIL